MNSYLDFRAFTEAWELLMLCSHLTFIMKWLYLRISLDSSEIIILNKKQNYLKED